MAPTRLTRLSITLLLMTSLVLVNTMTSALPSKPPVHDVHTATKTVRGWKSTPRTTDLGSVVDCPRGHFYSEGAMVCSPCSGCPVNQIIRRPCSARADTLCGPFFEFDKFHQSPVLDKPAGEKGKDNRVQGPRHREASGPASGQADQPTIRLQDGGQWRTLSFALIAVLSFICCVVVIVGLYVCVILRRSQSQRFIFREPESLTPHLYHDVGAESRYVEIPVMSRERIRTSRHLPVYQQIFTGSDAEFPSLTSSACDVKRDGAEQLCVYVNTAALDARGS